MQEQDPALLFGVFNEIGIIEQLSRTFLEAQLPDGLIAPHFAVLNHLTRVADGQTPVDMARAFQVPKTSMTHTLAGLEKRGLIKMRPNPDDGRSKRVWLAPEGQAMREQVIASLAPDLERLMRGVDTSKLITILPILTELRAYMDADRNAPAAPEQPASQNLGPADFI